MKFLQVQCLKKSETTLMQSCRQGEFVLPADVVRFIGLERLMKMRDEAKKGLQRMSDIGQMGNADEVGEASNGTYEDAGFESEIDDILR
jgi:hypothetical protein